MIVEDCLRFFLLQLLQLLSTKQRRRAFLVKWLMHFCEDQSALDKQTCWKSSKTQSLEMFGIERYTQTGDQWRAMACTFHCMPLRCKRHSSVSTRYSPHLFNLAVSGEDQSLTIQMIQSAMSEWWVLFELRMRRVELMSEESNLPTNLYKFLVF